MKNLNLRGSVKRIYLSYSRAFCLQLVNLDAKLTIAEVSVYLDESYCRLVSDDSLIDKMNREYSV